MIPTLLIVCLLVALEWCVFLVLLWRRERRMPELPRAEPGGDAAPRLSIVVPARNEEETLEAGLRSLLAQRGVGLDITLVNDHSTDRTGAIADALASEDARLRVLHNPPLPPGWMGKCNALSQGAAQAEGEYLLFTDADIVHDPDCALSAVREMQRKGLDFLTLLPECRWITFWENMLVPGGFMGFAVLCLMRLEDPKRPNEAFGAGAFLMLRAEVYRAIGGHAALRSAAIDDVQIARLLKRGGYRCAARLAPGLLACRMYRNNRDAFWAYSKNILDGIEGRPILSLLLASSALIPLTAASLSIGVGAALSSPWLAGVGAALYLYQYASFFIVRSVFRFDPVRLFAFPLGSLALVCNLARASYYRFVRGAILWRGREVPIVGADSRAASERSE